MDCLYDGQWKYFNFNDDFSCDFWFKLGYGLQRNSWYGILFTITYVEVDLAVIQITNEPVLVRGSAAPWIQKACTIK